MMVETNWIDSNLKGTTEKWQSKFPELQHNFLIQLNYKESPQVPNSVSEVPAHGNHHRQDHGNLAASAVSNSKSELFCLFFYSSEPPPPPPPPTPAIFKD